MRRGLITGVLGRILLGGGTLILLFVAYQLWGTDIAESHSQAVLRQRFEAQLHHEEQKGASSSTTLAPSTSTSSASTSTSSASTSTSSASTSTSSANDQPTVGATLSAPDDGSPVGVLQIPKLGLDKVIDQGTSDSDLRKGPGHYPGTPLPGEAGNAAIAGHRTTYGAPFFNLDQLARGDIIDVKTLQGSFTYRVTTTLVVSPSDTSVVANTTTPELTLTTCNPRFSASQRLVVHAALTTAPAPTVQPVKAAPPTVSGTGDLAGSQGDWVPPLEEGLLCAVVIAGVFVLARRRRDRAWRFTVYTVGGAVSLVALFFFFGAVSPLLPASF